MAYTLNKPFTDTQRADFIDKHQGLIFFENDSCIIMHLDSESVTPDGTVIDISTTFAYKEKVKKQLIQSELAKYNNAINDITNARLLDDLQHDSGIISDTVYNNRKTTRLNQFNQVKNTYYTNTGLTPPATITA